MTTETEGSKQSSVARRTSLQAANLLAAELAGTAVEIGVLSNVDKLDAAIPGIVHPIKKMIKACIIKPLMKPIEWCTQYTKGIEGQREYEERMARPQEVRAEHLAGTVFNYSLAATACYTVMFGVQQALNKASGVTMSKNSTAMLLGADAVIHLGAIAVMGSPAATRNTQNVKQAITCVFKSFGIDDSKANEMANYGVAVQFPNYLTYAADVGLLYALNKRLGAGHTHN